MRKLQLVVSNIQDSMVSDIQDIQDSMDVSDTGLMNISDTENELKLKNEITSLEVKLREANKKIETLEAEIMGLRSISKEDAYSIFNETLQILASNGRSGAQEYLYRWYAPDQLRKMDENELGFGTAVKKALLYYCNEKKLKPIYDSWQYDHNGVPIDFNDIDSPENF